MGGRYLTGNHSWWAKIRVEKIATTTYNLGPKQ
jgi:hypothetical protein